MVEQDWSGRGQHAEFNNDERDLVKNILHEQGLLGSTGSAIVQVVRCKRILLARKTIRCNRHLTRAKAIEEVAHLDRLDHSHIVRVIGTYVVGQELSILIYPVAEYNLEAFLHTIMQGPEQETAMFNLSYPQILDSFIICLSSALEYIHAKLIKHMDIKPQNILVRRVPYLTMSQYKAYLADFGIARSYSTIEATETEGPTMFTRKYAAPEVVSGDRKGLPADVFSMGCVFAEICATKASWSVETDKDGIPQYTASAISFPLFLCRARESNEHGDMSYQANTEAIHKVLDEMSSVVQRDRNLWHNSVVVVSGIVKRMMDMNPLCRPSAESLLQELGGPLPCCQLGQDPLTSALR